MDEWERRLRTTTPKKIRYALGLAEAAGWLRRRKGGGGKPDSYEFIRPSEEHESSHSDEPSDHEESSHTDGAQSGMIPHTQPESDRHDSSQSESDRHDSSHSEDQSGMIPHTLPSDRHESSHTDGVRSSSSSRTNEGSSNPPIVPPAEPFEIDQKVALQLEDETWDKCRSSLKDYFRSRVPTERQWGYLMSIQTWLDGAPSSPKQLHKLDPEQQKLLLASCLNELLQETDLDEKQYGSARGKAGQVYTLRAKMEFNLSRYFREQKKRATAQRNGSEGDSQPGLFPTTDPYGRPWKPMDEPVERSKP